MLDRITTRVFLMLASLLIVVGPKLHASQKEVHWERLMPAVAALVQQGSQAHARYPVTIARKVDITGDGIPEALIDTGGGGAYTDYLTLMRIEEGKPALARFKGMDGKVQAMYFAEGASAMNGEAVRMLPEKHALYLGHWSMGPSGQRLGTCTVEAYQWNPHSNAFEYNRALSRSLKDGFCRSVIDALRSNMPR